MGLHSKSGAIDWDEARRQGDVPGRAGAMRTCATSDRCDGCGVDTVQGAAHERGCQRHHRRNTAQLPLLDTTAPPVKRGLDPQDPDGEGWDERYYGAHSDGGD